MIAVELTSVSAQGPSERGLARPALAAVSLRATKGVLAILGSRADGTSLLFDVIDGTERPRSGQVVVLGGAPEAARPRVARVSRDAPLPEALRVDEICDLAAELRSEPARPANEILGPLGIAALAPRRASTLSIAERRTVALALALASTRVEVVLVEEPLAALDPVAPRRVVDALRARAASACVIVTTASGQDASRLADETGVLTRGSYQPIAPEHPFAAVGPSRFTSRIVVSPAHGKAGVAALSAALSADEAVTAVEASSFAGGAGGLLMVTGEDVERVARAITGAVARTRVDVELVEPVALPLDVLRAAMVSRVASPPPPDPPPAGPSEPLASEPLASEPLASEPLASERLDGGRG